jgi:PAS domain S-box-containing protein
MATSRARTLRSHLTTLVFASVVPILIFATIMAALFERQQRTSLERGFRETARALTVAVDHELIASVSTLQALATSKYLDSVDLELFYEQSQRALTAHENWATIALSDSKGQQLLNLRRPFGAPLPFSGNLPVVRRTLDTGQPAISDLSLSSVSKAPIVGITVPVMRGGVLKYVLGAGLDVSALTRLLSEGKLPPDVVATIFDRQGITVARTRGIEQWLGQSAPPAFAAQRDGAEEGSFRDVTREGVPVYAAYSRSHLSGWTVGLAVPVTGVEMPGRISLLAIIGAGVVFLLVAGTFATVFGRRIAGAIGTLSASARMLEQGRSPSSTGRWAIAEVENVEREMMEAAREHAEGVSERVKAEEALRESEATFRLLFSHNPLPMWVYDVTTLYFLEVNPAAVGHYGYSRDEFLSMRLGDIRPPEDVPRLMDVVARLATSTEEIQRHAGTWKHRLKDGQEIDVDILSHTMSFAGRRAALVVAIDVTELKRTQASLAESTERLTILHEIDRALIAGEEPVKIAEAALRRLRNLLDVPRAIVNIFDFAAGEAEWLAAAGRRRIRLGPGVRFSLELMGDVEALRRGELQVVDVTSLPGGPEAAALLAGGVSEYMVVPMIAGGELIGGLSFGGAPGQFPREQVGIAQEVATQLAIAIAQTRLDARVNRHAVELEQQVGERTHELSTANDLLQREIGERRRAEIEAGRANHAKSEFLSRMSHELRTPLNAVLGFAQLLEIDSLTAGQGDSVDHILRGGRHLLGLIDEVLDISRIEAGHLSISLEPVLLGEVIQETFELIQPVAATWKVRLDGELPEAGDCYVLADRQRLKQVLLNFLSNAVKFNRSGGMVRISVEEAPGARLRVKVSDTGPGIAPRLMGRLFTPFDRLGAETRGVEGTGLGLALSKRLAEVMGGAVGVDSVVGQGSTFWVELPRAESPVKGVAPPAIIPDEALPTRGVVLYIEDNLPNLRLVERLLAHRPNVKLLSAMLGSLGLEMAREHRPDLILLDLQLPDIPGAAVLARLQRDAETRQIPVIVISADATPGQIRRLRAAGAREFLTKPLDVKRLFQLLDDVLNDEQG